VFIPAVMSLMFDLAGTLRRGKPTHVTRPPLDAGVGLPADD
jgi:hypothetical protein